MGEAESLPESPTPRQLHNACVVGKRIGNRHSAPRVKCRSEQWPKRWTTVEWWLDFLAAVNEEA